MLHASNGSLATGAWAAIHHVLFLELPGTMPSLPKPALAVPPTVLLPGLTGMPPMLSAPGGWSVLKAFFLDMFLQVLTKVFFFADFFRFLLMISYNKSEARLLCHHGTRLETYTNETLLLFLSLSLSPLPILSWAFFNFTKNLSITQHFALLICTQNVSQVLFQVRPCR